LSYGPERPTGIEPVVACLADRLLALSTAALYGTRESNPRRTRAEGERADLEARGRRGRATLRDRFPSGAPPT